MGQDILTPTQHSFLQLAAAEEKITNWYYLTGGTALSAFYLQHRLSEDLDLFSQSDVNEGVIDKFIGKAAKKLKAEFTKEKHLRIFIYYLKFPKEETLKVDFASRPFKELENSLKKYNALKIASLWDIVVDKFYTILHRQNARDFVDLYFGIKEAGCSVEQLISALEEKYELDFSILSTAGSFLHVKDLEDYPQMLVPFNREKMENFYLKLAKDLESKIFK